MDLSNILKNGYILRNDNNYAFYKNNKIICSKSNIEFDNIIDLGQERLGKDQSYLLDSESIRRKFNWEDHISLEEGLSQTLNWIKTHLCILKKMEWDYHHKK